MDTKYPIPDDRSKRHVVENVANSPPKFYIEFSFNLIIKTINFIDFGTFMISSQKEKVVGKFYFESHE
jgi:hypothetical protein